MTSNSEGGRVEWVAFTKPLIQSPTKKSTLDDTSTKDAELRAIAQSLEQIERQRRDLLNKIETTPVKKPPSIKLRSSPKLSPPNSSNQSVLFCECGEEVLVTQYQRHKETLCTYRRIRCLKPGCGKSFPAYERRKHELLDCLTAKKTRQILQNHASGLDPIHQCERCQGDTGSSPLLSKKQLRQHQLHDCPKRIVPCSFAEWGCEMTFPADSTDLHMQNECIVAQRRAAIARDAEKLSETTVCDWCENIVPKRKLLDHQEDECPKRERPCPNAERGCVEWVPVEDFDHHVKTECSVTLLRNDLAERARRQNEAVACPECGESIKRGKMPKHWKEECISRVVRCKNSLHGCKVQLRWRERHLHEDFTALAKHRTLLQFPVNADARINLRTSLDVDEISSKKDEAPPWTAEYYLWMIDEQEDVLGLMYAALKQYEVQLNSQNELVKWKVQAEECNKKFRAIKSTQRKAKGKALSAAMTVTAKALAEESGAAEKGVSTARKTSELAKGWVEVYVQEANQLLLSVKTKEEKEAIQAAVKDQTMKILEQRSSLASLLDEEAKEMVASTQKWCARIRPASSSNTASTQKKQQVALRKRSQIQEQLENVVEDADDAVRLRRKYERELAKVDSKLAILSDSMPVELLARRGRHVIASSYSNAISLSHKGSLVFFRQTSRKRGAVDLKVKLPRNQWTHLTLSASATELQVYVDGVLKATKAGTFQLPLEYIGSSAPSESFQGFIKEIRYWKEVRTVSKIQQFASTVLPVTTLYNTGRMLGYWTLEEAMGDAVDDMSLSRPRVACIYTKWVALDTPELRHKFGALPTPSLRESSSCVINQRLQHLAQRASDRLHVKVPCRQQCQADVLMVHLEKHHRLECPHRMVACREVGCGRLYRFCDQSQHNKNRCERKRYRELLVDRYHAKEELEECELGCGVMVKNRFMREHYRAECPNRLVECPQLDCPESVKAKAVGRHLALDCKSRLMRREIEMVQNARKRQHEKGMITR